MNINFSIPIKYVTKYASNNTTDEKVREFINGMVSDWLDEDADVYEHYEELERIANGEDV